MTQKRPSRTNLGGEVDRSAALDALDAEELRAFIREALDALEPAARGPIEDALVRRAATRGRYRPAAPSSAVVDEVVEFAAAARRVGYAEPFEVDAYLRRGITASLAGEHDSARRIFESLLLPIAQAEIDLGQQEMVEEVLSVDLLDCIARYLLAILLATPSKARAEAVLSGAERLQGLGVPVEPVRSMENALGRELPNRDEFLDAWIERLENSAPCRDDWESEREQWLRDAVVRREGTAGLARIARATRRPEVVAAWCRAVVKEGNWKRALGAYEEAAKLATSDLRRGEFLDGAALAASKLERKDAIKRLEVAWKAAPSLPRLLRWLVTDDANGAVVRRRATTALEASVTQSSRLVAFLRLLTGDVPAAAKALKAAPGLGWSSGNHPGHLLFPVFTWMLGNEKASGGVDVLKHLPRPVEIPVEPDDPSSTPPTPTVLDVLERVDAYGRVSPNDRASALDAMRAAASKRTDGVTCEKRRRHYRHAAALVACCLEVDRAGSTGWFEALRARTSRFPAFQEALRGAVKGGRAFARLELVADGA